VFSRVFSWIVFDPDADSTHRDNGYRTASGSERDKAHLESRSHPLTRMVLTTCDKLTLPAKALPDQIRHLDEKGAPVATKAGLELAGERAETVAGQVVVISNVKRCARIRGVAK